jgi:glutaminyl-tRNA synthetase
LTACPQVEALLGPKTEADLVKPDKKKKAAKPAAAPAAAMDAATNGTADAAAAKKPEEEAWRTADPYAFLPKPEQNNMVHTTVHFRCGRERLPSIAAGRLARVGS